MSSPVHIMLDLETLGTAPGSVILSIGACVFDANGPSANPDHRFERHICAVESVEAGLTMDPGTALWWIGQSEPARAALLAGQKDAKRLLAALTEFSDWLKAVAPDAKKRLIWGKGPSFDCGLLAAAYRANFTSGQPWRYSNERCVRTLADMAPHIPEPVRAGTHHSALDDALHQARHCGAILASLAGSASGPPAKDTVSFREGVQRDAIRNLQEGLVAAESREAWPREGLYEILKSLKSAIRTGTEIDAEKVFDAVNDLLSAQAESPATSSAPSASSAVNPSTAAPATGIPFTPASGYKPLIISKTMTPAPRFVAFAGEPPALPVEAAMPNDKMSGRGEVQHG